MQITDLAIRVDANGTVLEGTRDRAFKARTGNWIGYEDLGFGGDCSLSLVVDGNVLAASTTQTTLKARCAGDSFQQDVYACAAK